MEAVLGVFIPIIIFASIPIMVWTVSHYRHKTQKSNADILIAMANKGEAITPELIQALGVQKKPKNHDLRRGVILISIAIASFILAKFIPEADAQSVLTGLAMFPLFVGIAYIGLWALVSRKET